MRNRLERASKRAAYKLGLITAVAVVGVVFFAGLGSYFRLNPGQGPTRNETKVAEERKPTLPMPATTPMPAPSPSASNTEKDKEIATLREENAKLKATAKPNNETKSQSWGEWFSSWKSVQLPSAPSFTPAPTTTAPAPSIAAPPAVIDRPKSSLDKTIAEIQEKAAGKRVESTPTPSPSSLPSVPPPPKVASTPAAKAETSFFTFPTLPSPPSIKSVSLKGPSGSSGGFFSGGCSAREEEVDLATVKDNDGWLTLTEGGKDECYITDFYHTDAIIQARDGMGEFFLKPGVTRNPRAVKLVAGRGYFKYSACTRTPEARGHALDWDCSIR